MSNSDNAARPPASASCAWCGAEIEGRATGGTDHRPADTICPRCEADFESLSKSPDADRKEHKRQSSRDTAATSAWLIRRRRGWVTVWLILLSHLPLLA